MENVQNWEMSGYRGIAKVEIVESESSMFDAPESESSMFDDHTPSAWAPEPKWEPLIIIKR